MIVTDEYDALKAPVQGLSFRLNFRDCPDIQKHMFDSNQWNFQNAVQFFTDLVNCPVFKFPWV